MGSGRGKSRRARAGAGGGDAPAMAPKWAKTLDAVFPVDQVNAQFLLENKPTLKRLVQLSSEIRARGFICRPHRVATGITQDVYEFADGHSVVCGKPAGGYSYGRQMVCDCPRSFTEKGSAYRVCGHKMGTLVNDFIDKCEDGEYAQPGLDALRELAAVGDDVEAADAVHEKLMRAVQSHAEAQPKDLSRILAPLKREGTTGTKSLLSEFLKQADYCQENGSPEARKYSEFVEITQEEAKGQVIPLPKDSKIRREMKAAMFTGNDYKGFNPVITPTLMKEQTWTCYGDEHGNGIAIIEIGNGHAYASLDVDARRLSVGFLGQDGDEPKYSAYAAYMFPFLMRANEQNIEDKHRGHEIIALKEFPGAFHDSARGTVEGVSVARMHSLGAFTGTIYKAAIYAKNIDEVVRTHGNHKTVRELWKPEERVFEKEEKEEFAKVSF